MKKTVLIKDVFIFFLFFINMTAASLASEADENVARIQKAYENIKDLKGAFTQKNTIKDLGKSDTYRGEFLIKYPLRMKWMYKGKTLQDIIINNEDVLIYKKGDNQAYKGKFDKNTYGQTPVALLSGLGNIKEEFNISGKGDTLILTPKRPVGTITSIKITMSDDDFPVRSFVIQDGHSNVIEIELKDVKINTGLKDSLFEFSLPKGVNIYEQHP